MNSRKLSPELLELALKGLQEILPLEEFFNKKKQWSNTPEDLIESMISIEKEFGEVSAVGVFFRGGEAAFKHFVWKYGKAIDIDSFEYRLQPQQRKLIDGLRKLISRLDDWQAGSYKIDQTEEKVEVRISFPNGYDFVESRSCWLYFIAGMIHEFLSWAGGGKHYPFNILQNPSVGGLIIQFQTVPID